MNEDTTARTYRAEVVSRLLRVSPATLRRYERHGLVQPRRVGRTSLYSDVELRQLRRIRRLTVDLGVNLAGTAIILRLVERLEESGGRAADE